MSTKLAFRTPPCGVAIPAGQSKQLGTIDVAGYSKIRVVAVERVGAPSTVLIRMTLSEGGELVAQLDVLSLSPCSQVTRVYDVPGTQLTVYAEAMSGSGSDGIDLLVYGS